MLKAPLLALVSVTDPSTTAVQVILEPGRRLRGVHVVPAEADILVERHAVAAGTLAFRP
jgi:hypothetical protein